MREMKESLDLKYEQLKIAEERLVIEEHQRLLEDEKKRREERWKMEEQRRRLEEERRRIEELHRRTTEKQRKQEQLRLERQRAEAEKEKERTQRERTSLEEERVRLMELHRKMEEEHRLLTESPHTAEKDGKHPTTLCDSFTSEEEKVKDFKRDENEHKWETESDAYPVDSNRLLDEIDLLLNCNSEVLAGDESYPCGNSCEQDDADRGNLKEVVKSDQEKVLEQSTDGGRNKAVREIRLVPWKNLVKDESEQKVSFSFEIEDSLFERDHVNVIRGKCHGS